jgi:hypothetical protein
MSTATVPPEVAALLGRFRETTELRDIQGLLLGVYTPAELGTNVAPASLPTSFDINRAKATLERERDLGRPLQEILATFKAREAKK